MFPLLETLVAVYECRQFTLAAYELKVSQSTVSARIAQLERTAGARLFVRNARSEVTPTEVEIRLIGGDRYQHHAQRQHRGEHRPEDGVLLQQPGFPAQYADYPDGDKSEDECTHGKRQPDDLSQLQQQPPVVFTSQQHQAGLNYLLGKIELKDIQNHRLQRVLKHDGTRQLFIGECGQDPKLDHQQIEMVKTRLKQQTTRFDQYRQAQVKDYRAINYYPTRDCLKTKNSGII